MICYDDAEKEEKENNDMAEYWDLYDENRNSLGKTIKRGDAFAEGNTMSAAKSGFRIQRENF